MDGVTVDEVKKVIEEAFEEAMQDGDYGAAEVLADELSNLQYDDEDSSNADDSHE